MIFQTERLVLRELTQADFTGLAALLQNPEVMYAYEHSFTDADVQEWLERQLARYEKYGFGLWALVLKASGELLGQAGLTMQTCGGRKLLEVGYLLQPRHWHRGCASEAAAGCVRYAFETLGAPKVHSIIKTDNLASIRVAERIGMKREREFLARYYNGDVPHFLYAAEKTQARS